MTKYSNIEILTVLYQQITFSGNTLFAIAFYVKLYGAIINVITSQITKINKSDISTLKTKTFENQFSASS